jgi:uncharacterized protein with von Willebrand factor type A (vWA) domain
MTTRAACYDVPKFHTRLWTDFAKTADQVPAIVEEGDRKVAGFGEGFVPEMFHRMFADTPREIPADKRESGAAMRARLHALASELPEVETLRTRTLHNELWSGMAASEIAESVAKAIPARKTPPPDADAARRVLRGMQSLVRRDPSREGELAGELAEAEGKARGEAFATAEEAGELDESAVRTAMREGVAAAHEAIEEASAALDAFGWGDGTPDPSKRTPAMAVELARKVASSKKLQRIVEMAGRLKATARAKRATRSDFARSEIVGIEPVGDFSELVPGELVNLAHPMTAADLASRVSERGALGYELKGTDKLAKGPLVVGIDCSGSMGDDKDVWSKAIAMALLDAAKRDRRPFGVFLFDGDVVEELYAPKPDDVDTGALLNILLRGASGGCDFDLPIVPALDVVEKAGKAGSLAGGKLAKADVVLITDACIGSHHNKLAPASMARAERIGAHVFGILIGGHDDGTLARWCHETAHLDDVHEDAKAVDLIFDGILPE